VRIPMIRTLSTILLAVLVGCGGEQAPDSSGPPVLVFVFSGIAA
jgi:hypothetical protein